MSCSGFGLFTADGERLARSLFEGICIDVEADRLTRLQALQRAADAMEQISEIEDGLNDPDTVDRIARCLSQTFSRVGFVSVDGDALVAFYEKWKAKGDEVHSEAIDPEVDRVSRAARKCSEVLKNLAANDKLSLGVSEHPVWEPEFSLDESDVGIFVHRGDVTGITSLCVIILGKEGYAYVDQALQGSEDENIDALKQVLGRENENYSEILTSVKELFEAVHQLNLESYLVSKAEHLTLKVSKEFNISPLWDGQELASAELESGPPKVAFQTPSIRIDGPMVVVPPSATGESQDKEMPAKQAPDAEHTIQEDLTLRASK